MVERTAPRTSLNLPSGSFASQSFPSQNIPTITTTQSIEDLHDGSTANNNGGGRGGGNTIVNMEPTASSTLTLPLNGHSTETLSNRGGNGPSGQSGWTTMTPQEISYWIDRRSRFLFPCAFVIFNAFYWTFVYCL